MGLKRCMFGYSVRIDEDGIEQKGHGHGSIPSSSILALYPNMLSYQLAQPSILLLKRYFEDLCSACPYLVWPFA